MIYHNIAPRRSVYCAVLALALASSCAYAQSENTTAPAAEETELAPVTVSAHEGQAVPYDQTGVSVTVLDVEELKKEGMYSLSEALTTAPGVYVLPGGGGNQRGNTSDIIIRGMNSQKYVMPMMDGMRLGGGLATGSSNLASNIVARMPIFGLGALELVRGAQGAVYGSGSMAGVLYMETPEGKGEPSLSIFNEYGSFDSYTGNVTAQGRVQDTAYFVSATYDHTNNNFRYADGSRPQAKHTARYTNASEALRLDQYINDRNQLTLTYRREDSDYRHPDNGIYDFRTNLVTLKFQTQVSDKYTSSVMVGYYGNDWTMGARGTAPWGTYYYDLRNVQVEWRNAIQWNEANKTTAGIMWSRTDFETTTDGKRQQDSSSLDSVLSFLVEHSVEPVKGWNSTLALRLDESNTYHSLFSMRASTNYKFNRERTRVFASVGRGYAAPGSFERSNVVYEGAWGTYYGNPRLKCENNWSVDFGVEQQVAKDHYLSATLFWSRIEDGIFTDSEFDPQTWATKYYYKNDTSHWTTQGVELALHGVFEKNWNTGYKLACTISQPKQNNDRQLANSARQVWTADVHTSPIKGLTTGLGLSAAVGRTGFKMGDSARRIDNYLVLRWYANYEVNEHLSLHMRVENLTNQKYEIEPNWGEKFDPAGTIISAGIGVFGGCTVKF